MRKGVECHIFSGLGGFFTNKGTRLLEKLIDDLPIEVNAMHHAHREFGKVAEGIIARSSMFGHQTTVLIGHSYGALSCIKVARALAEKGFSIAYVAGIDPTALPASEPAMSVPDNVARVDEFHAARGVPATTRKVDPSGKIGGMFVYRQGWPGKKEIIQIPTAHIASASHETTRQTILAGVERALKASADLVA